jgi:hypothetical protein
VTPWANYPDGRTPRVWQREALPAIGAAWRRGERPVVRAVTGAGKASLVAEIATLMQHEGVVVAAPRQSLVEQLSGIEGEPTFRAGSIAWRAGGDRVGVFYGQKKQPDRPIVVTCNPSLERLVPLLEGRPCGVLIVDECHRSESPSFLAAVEALKPKRIVGMTATPWRSERRESLGLFDSLAYDYGLGRAIADGVLVPWDTVGWEGEGDSQIDVVSAGLIRQHGHGPGIVSAASIPDAERYAALLTHDGIPAEAIHSELARGERKDRIARLLDGRLRCLVHVALLQEGVDIPELRWLCMRRPTSTSIRFVQELGRILRTCPGKSRALLLDPYDMMGTIGLVHDPAIGPAEQLEDVMQREAGNREPSSGDAPEPPQFPPAVAVSQITRWARQSYLALVEAGLCEAPLRGTRWREALPSEAQLRALRAIGGTEARAVLAHVDVLTRGEVSDMIGFLSALRAAKRERKQLPELPLVPASAVESLAARGRAA